MNDTARNGRIRMNLIGLLLFSGMGAAASDAPLAFTRDQEIMFLSAGSAKPIALAKGSSAALSPSGTAVAYLSPGSDGETKSIVSITTDKKAKRTLFKSQYPLRNLRWSRQGKLLFLVLKGSKEELHYLEPGALAAKTSSTRIPRPAGANAFFSPRWTPDGKSIMFQDLDTVFRIDLAGRVLSKWSVQLIAGRGKAIDSLCTFTINPQNPNLMLCSWTVEGTDRFFEVFGGEPNTALFTFDLATKTRKRLTPKDMVCADPVWSRDGKTIFLCGYREAHYKQAYPFRIYSIKPDGSSLTEICKGEDPHP